MHFLPFLCYVYVDYSYCLKNGKTQKYSSTKRNQLKCYARIWQTCIYTDREGGRGRIQYSRTNEHELKMNLFFFWMSVMMNSTHQPIYLGRVLMFASQQNGCIYIDIQKLNIEPFIFSYCFCVCFFLLLMLNNGQHCLFTYLEFVEHVFKSVFFSFPFHGEWFCSTVSLYHSEHRYTAHIDFIVVFFFIFGNTAKFKLTNKQMQRKIKYAQNVRGKRNLHHTLCIHCVQLVHAHVFILFMGFCLPFPFYCENKRNHSPSSSLILPFFFFIPFW